jgi:hypothetical protein
LKKKDKKLRDQEVKKGRQFSCQKPVPSLPQERQHQQNSKNSNGLRFLDEALMSTDPRENPETPRNLTIQDQLYHSPQEPRKPYALAQKPHIIRGDQPIIGVITAPWERKGLVAPTRIKRHNSISRERSKNQSKQTKSSREYAP